MEQNFDSGPGFWAMVQNGPEMAQNGKSLTTPTVLKLRTSYFRVMLTYPRAKNSWNKILIRVPVFGLWSKMGPKWPKTEKNRIAPTVLKLRSSYFIVMLTYHRAKNSWNGILIRVSIFGLRSKTGLKWPKTEKSNYSHSFKATKLLF